jgi:O-antigen/teichoic acid export membrane protein
LNISPTFLRRRLAHRPNLLKILDNIGWLFFDKVLRIGVGLLLGVWLARYLGPAQFGLLNFALAFTALFSAIASLGLQAIVVRDLVRDPESSYLTLGTTGTLQLIAGFLSYMLILGVIPHLRHEDSLDHLIVVILGVTTLFKASEIAVYWFESQLQSKYTVWVQNGIFIIFAAIKVGLIFIDAQLIAFVWAMVIESALIAITLLKVFNLRGIALTRLKTELGRAKTLLKDSWPLLLSGIAVSIYMKIDQIMLGQMIGDQAVGIYSAAARISEVWYFIPMAIVASVFPALIKTRAASIELYYMRLQNFFFIMVLISIAVAVPITFYSNELVSLLFGPIYSDAGFVLATHVWASVFVFLGVAGNCWLMAENLQKIILQRTILGAISNVALNLILIPKIGVNGAAISLVISQAITSLLLDGWQKRTRAMFWMKIRAMNPFNWYFFIFQYRHKGN